jgi:hypothetical protein
MKKSTWKEIWKAFEDFFIIGRPQYELNKKAYESNPKLSIILFLVFILVFAALLTYFK